MAEEKSASLPSLAYWNGRGLMEVPRMLLAAKGKFPGDYKDGRYTTDAPDERQDAFSEVQDKLDSNLGRMPVLFTDEGDVGQSVAINYYLAAELGLLGTSNLEGAQILAIQEHVREMMTAFRKQIPYGTEPTDEQLDAWFASGADDTTGKADGSRRAERFLRWFAGRIEGQVGEGFAVGGALSLADLVLYNVFAETLAEESAPEGMPAWKREPMGSKARMDSVLEACPKIRAICEAVAADENIAQYLATRGHQRF